MKLKAKSVIAFDYADLEKLVKEVYGVEVRILQDLIPFERVGHYTYHEFDVDGESELEDIDDEEIVAEWIETGLDRHSDLHTRHILHRLFNDGHIVAGRYIMLVDW